MQMPKIKLLLIFCFFVCNANSQSLIQKFVENTFTLSDAKKSPDGYFYENIAYDIQNGSILMINAIGNETGFRPLFIIKGPTENGKEEVPTFKFFDTTNSNETNAVYVINKTGTYNIIIANGNKGEKGTVKTKMGLGSVDWLEDKAIFPTTNNSPFALALAGLLRHAIFNFNLIKGEKDMFSNYKTTLIMPDALMNDAGTKFGIYTDLDSKMDVGYYHGCAYVMNNFTYLSSYNKKGDDKYEWEWDQADTTKAIIKYENLKILLANALTTDFVLEREANFSLFSESKDKWRIRKNGRRIIFAHKGNEAIIDPGNKFYSLLASKKMKVELCLHSDNIHATISLRVYSEEK